MQSITLVTNDLYNRSKVIGQQLMKDYTAVKKERKSIFDRAYEFSKRSDKIKVVIDENKYIHMQTSIGIDISMVMVGEQEVYRCSNFNRIKELLTN